MGAAADEIDIATVLFDEIGRTDRRPADHSEGSFRFLNRVDAPYWQRVRDVMEEWFGRVPSDSAADIRGRFRDRDDRQHMGAFWELYVHEALRREGFTMTGHPDLVGSPHKPDFLAHRGDESFYVEATVSWPVGEQLAAERRRSRFYDAVNKCGRRTFFFGSS